MCNQNNDRHAVSMHLVHSYATLLLVVTTITGSLMSHCCNASVIYPNYDIGQIGDQITDPIITAPAGASAVATAALFTASVGHPAQRTPIKTAQDIMVDITNRFAFSVMNVHTERGGRHDVGDAFGRYAKHDNFVFSPCGLTSVLIALYEGSNGHSAYEIYRAMRLPWNRDIVRIGVRDIHRRLRLYFYDNTNLLDGLSLSRDNVTIRQDYETILRFYGYDLNPDTKVFNEKSTTTALKPPNLSTTPSPSYQPTPTKPTTVDMRMIEEMSPSQTTEKITSPIENEVEITTIPSKVPATEIINPSAASVDTTIMSKVMPTSPVSTTTEIAMNKEIPFMVTTSSSGSMETQTTSPEPIASVTSIPMTTLLPSSNPNNMPSLETTLSSNDMITLPALEIEVNNNPIEVITTKSPPTVGDVSLISAPTTTQAGETSMPSSVVQPQQTETTVSDTTKSVMETSPTQPAIDNISATTNLIPGPTTSYPEMKSTEAIDGYSPVNPTLIVDQSTEATTLIADKIEYPISTTQIVFTNVSDKMEFPSNQLDPEKRMMESEAVTITDQELDQQSPTTYQPTYPNHTETATTKPPYLMTTYTDSPITIIRFTTIPVEDSLVQTTPITLAPLIARRTTFRPITNFVKDSSSQTTTQYGNDLQEITSMTPRNDDITTDFPESTTKAFVTFRPLLSRQSSTNDRSSRTFYSNTKELNQFIRKPMKSSNISSASPFVLEAPSAGPFFNRARITRKRINKRSVFHLPYTHLDPVDTEFELDFDDYAIPGASLDDPFGHHPQNNIRLEQTKYSPITHHEESDEFPLPFHITKHETIQAPFKRFNTLLRLGYVPALHASVLELPLDSDKYVIMLLLPDQAFDLNGVMQRMSTVVAPTIREIRSGMRQFWIKASVPKFFLKGNVVLTGDLMKLGIKSIFDPTHADFTPLTDELPIYAKHIEQMVTMNIRTHANNLLRRNTLDADIYKPIEVNVQQPFVFCVVDREIDLAIMIGQIVNPLNSRIS